jgi:cytochrome c oxidase cbb3-type subunit 2
MMAGRLYGKPIIFAVVSLLVIFIGTIAVMFFPMFLSQMHPKLETLHQYTPLELAGKDIYQREGCNNCHTQTVRPLKTEVMRYGEYSKAGEFAYDRPFLWGSKRTGPDLARVGLKYPDAWHYMHFEDPQSIAPKSNMPNYYWIKENQLDRERVRAHMDALDFKYDEKEIEALKGKNELDALVAYMMSLGQAVAESVETTSVQQEEAAEVAAGTAEMENPMVGDPAAVERGSKLFASNCVVCHGAGGEGGIGANLTDNVWLGKSGDISDAEILEIISHGTKKGMPPFGTQLSKDDIWSLVTFIRTLKK